VSEPSTERATRAAMMRTLAVGAFASATRALVLWRSAAVGRFVSAAAKDEFMAAYRREGTAITTRENIHRMADANKAFAHFAW